MTLGLLLPESTYAHLSQQGEAPLRLRGRQVRLAREAGGEYRVVEVVQVDAGDLETISAVEKPLPLLVLPDGARGVSGLGGDLAPGQVMERESHIALIGDLPDARFEFAVTYTLPPDARDVAFAARVATDSLVIFIDRGGVEARPDRVLERRQDIGSRAQPRRQYVVNGLAAGTAVNIGLGAERIGARERLAVFLATLLSAAVLGGWVWRRSDHSNRSGRV